MRLQGFLLRDVLLQPRVVRDFDLADWDRLIQQARSAGLLARVCGLLKDVGELSRVPVAVRWHLEAAWVVYEAHCQDILLEVAYLRDALATVGLRPVLLKGAAYLAAGDGAAMGRMFSDVDIFLPRDRLPEAEQVLRWQGWVGEELSAYDQAYYREWMHEIPPLSHRARGIAVDVHHNLLPLTSRVRLDAQALAAATVPSSWSGVDTLAPADRVLHSAAHLLLEGEFDNAFRDLSDLHLLIEAFLAEDGLFWSRLVSRARALGLGRVLYYALGCLQRLMSLQVPAEVVAELRGEAPAAPLAWLMALLFDRAMLPAGVPSGQGGQSMARLALYCRSHYLKMPLPLLVRHLWHKAFITPLEYRKDAA